MTENSSKSEVSFWTILYLHVYVTIFNYVQNTTLNNIHSTNKN